VLSDTRPQPDPANAPDGIAALPSGSDADDALAALYAWPQPDSRPGRAGTPVVRANMIASLDGGTTVAGRSAGLGNPADEHLFTLLRDLADVILVGSGTVRAEQYGGIRLDAARRARRLRWGLSAEPPPIAVVTARGLDPQLPLFTDTETPPIVITTRQRADAVPSGARTIAAGHDRVNFADAIGVLGADGFRRIHCEGGPGLLGSLVAADLLDECCLTIAPLLLGSGTQPMLPVALHDPARWRLMGARVDGDHLFTRYRRTHG
jgi:riboflavin biosynthesis pyrimidine reductase